MTFRALEKSIRVLEKSWKSPGNLFLKKGTNPVEAKSNFMGANDSSLFMCMFCDQVIAFWTSPHIPGVACEDTNFFTTVTV